MRHLFRSSTCFRDRPCAHAVCLRVGPLKLNLIQDCSNPLFSNYLWLEESTQVILSSKLRTRPKCTRNGPRRHDPAEQVCLIRTGEPKQEKQFLHVGRRSSAALTGPTGCAIRAFEAPTLLMETCFPPLPPARFGGSIMNNVRTFSRH